MFPLDSMVDLWLLSHLLLVNSEGAVLMLGCCLESGVGTSVAVQPNVSQQIFPGHCPHSESKAEFGVML